jgi:hypothetical protein
MPTLQAFLNRDKNLQNNFEEYQSAKEQIENIEIPYLHPADIKELPNRSLRELEYSIDKKISALTELKESLIIQ